jgi:hypothetical protein
VSRELEIDMGRLEVGLVYLDEPDLLMDVVFFRGGWIIDEAGKFLGAVAWGLVGSKRRGNLRWNITINNGSVLCQKEKKNFLVFKKIYANRVENCSTLPP